MDFFADQLDTYQGIFLIYSQNYFQIIRNFLKLPASKLYNLKIYQETIHLKTIFPRKYLELLKFPRKILEHYQKLPDFTRNRLRITRFYPDSPENYLILLKIA